MVFILQYSYMKDFHNIFLNAIQEKEILKLKIKSKEKWIIFRDCAPLDFWPHARFKDNIDRYMLFHIDSWHSSPLIAEQILGYERTWTFFNPWELINKMNMKPPYKWHFRRDWGIYS